MTISREIPGAGSFELDHLLLDVNGTLANRAQLIDGVDERLDRCFQLMETDDPALLEGLRRRTTSLGGGLQRKPEALRVPHRLQEQGDHPRRRLRRRRLRTCHR